MRIFRAMLFAAIFVGFVAGAAQAVPVLQLDMKGGVYDPITETIVAPGGSNVEVFALLTPGKTTSRLTANYYLSIALQPAISTPADLGLFSVNGTDYSVTGGLTYGNPPIETIASLQGYDPGDLPQHGVFPTYFAEVQFKFNPADRASTYDTSLAPGGPTANANGKTYFATFTLDTTGLSGDYYLHFDLYDEVTRTCALSKSCTPGDIDVSRFAPFSHDAQTTPPTPQPPVPDGGATLILLGGALVGIAALRRRFNA